MSRNWNKATIYLIQSVLIA